jgi:hypothetical protein
MLELESLSEEKQEFVNKVLGFFIGTMQGVVEQESTGFFDEKQKAVLMEMITKSVKYGVEVGITAVNLKES